MLTSQLFEQWDIDTGVLVDVVAEIVGPCDIYLGGSLADDLGNSGSDIDLYCFLREGAPVPPRPPTVHCGGAAIDLVIAGGAYSPAERESLLPLLLGPAEAPEDQLPLLSPGLFRQLYALYRDRKLAGQGWAEVPRQRFGADLLHLYLAMRSTLATAALAEDLLALRSSGHLPAATYSARLACEYAIDAALASEGFVTVNPKWRVALLEQARMQCAMPDAELTQAGLFPDPRNGLDALRNCLEAASVHLEHALANPMLARLHVVRGAAQLVADSGRAWRLAS
jgi:hypothetical protein